MSACKRRSLFSISAFIRVDPRLFLLTLLAVASSAAPARAQLTAEQLVLIANKNEPEGVKLASYYAKARGVPVAQVCLIDAPTSEGIDFQTYESIIAPQIREFLRTNELDEKIRCLVTFYGVPLKIGPRQLSQEDQRKLADLRQNLIKVCGRLAPLATEIEKVAREMDPQFTPVDQSQSLISLKNRIAKAGQLLSEKGPAIPDPARREQLGQKVAQLTALIRQPIADEAHPTTLPAELDLAALSADPQKARALHEKAWDPQSRALTRAIAAQGGMLSYADLLGNQIEYLTADQNESCVDSELALVNWIYYSRKQWMINPLSYQSRHVGEAPKIYMTARLDAPTTQIVQRMIDDAITVEREGLEGKIVIDARGLGQGAPATNQPRQQDGYAQADERLRILARIIRSQTKMNLIFDDAPDVLMPGALDDVALYCGWYSPGLYVKSIAPKAGSVGYHIASFEMQSLHDPNNRGWVPNLLRDGMTATLGPTFEPYLAAFPRADDFFPLLLTGKLTLAEVYWKTAPLCSWQMGLVGDPLYTPFKVNPQIEPDALAKWLKPLVSEAR